MIAEIDGGTHDAPCERAKDSKRTAALMALGYKIVRVHNKDVCGNIDGVLDQLLAVLTVQDI